jgi:hypothetical protein
MTIFYRLSWSRYRNDRQYDVTGLVHSIEDLCTSVVRLVGKREARTSRVRTT